MRKRTLTAILPVVAVAFALLSAGPAGAAWGTIGSYQGAQASCLNGKIMVTAPQMQALPVSLGSNVIVIGPSHTQWVAYRAWVYHVESRQWIPGPWKAREATDDGWSGLFSDSWYDFSARGWATGTTTFNINSAGTYWAYAEYYWYADQYVGAGGHGEFVALNDYNSGRLGTSNTCRF